MQLLTKVIRKKLPKLGAQDGLGGKAIAHVKFFTPDSSWTWYITEFDGKDTFFGMVYGLEWEFGYVSLAELEAVTGAVGLHVERDLHWTPKTLAEIAPYLFS